MGHLSMHFRISAEFQLKLNSSKCSGLFQPEASRVMNKHT